MSESRTVVESEPQGQTIAFLISACGVLTILAAVIFVFVMMAEEGGFEPWMLGYLLGGFVSAMVFFGFSSIVASLGVIRFRQGLMVDSVGQRESLPRVNEEISE